MRDYEITLIVHPDSLPESVGQIVENLSGIITDSGGEVQHTGQLVGDGGKIVERPEGDWQKRNLAYPIKKETEGYYLTLQTQMPPDVIPALERNLVLNEAVIRHMFVRVDE